MERIIIITPLRYEGQEKYARPPLSQPNYKSSQRARMLNKFVEIAENGVTGLDKS